MSSEGTNAGMHKAGEGGDGGSGSGSGGVGGSSKPSEGGEVTTRDGKGVGSGDEEEGEK